VSDQLLRRKKELPLKQWTGLQPQKKEPTGRVIVGKGGVRTPNWKREKRGADFKKKKKKGFPEIQKPASGGLKGGRVLGPCMEFLLAGVPRVPKTRTAKV